MRGEERDVLGDRPLKAFRFDRKMAEILPGELRTLPSDGGNIGRWREQLFHDRLAPFGDQPNPIILSRRERPKALLKRNGEAMAGRSRS
jgi:hypothetical protein